MKPRTRLLRCVTALWLLSSGLAAAGMAARAVPDAPQVPPAPMVDQPLAPPANDVPEERPSAQHVWVRGHWAWSDGAYVWETGRWQVPPGANLVWQAPQWQRAANGYVLRDGGWVEAGKALPETPVVTAPAPVPALAPVAPPPPAQSPSQPVVVQPTPPPQVIVMAPPPPRREVVRVRPSSRHVWLPGYWAWRGNRYVWIAGHYALPPRGHRTWVEPRWERRGGVYIFIEGRWR